MTIKDEKTYNEIEERMEALLAKGTQLGGMDFLSEVEKEELKVLSEAAYDWECEVDPHPWRVKPSLIAAIKVAFRQKGYKQKEAAKAIGVSTTALVIFSMDVVQLILMLQETYTTTLVSLPMLYWDKQTIRVYMPR